MQALRRPLNFAIADEVDSLLIDDCRNPFLLSGPDFGADKNRYKVAAQVILNT